MLLPVWGCPFNNVKITFAIRITVLICVFQTSEPKISILINILRWRHHNVWRTYIRGGWSTLAQATPTVWVNVFVCVGMYCERQRTYTIRTPYVGFKIYWWLFYGDVTTKYSVRIVYVCWRWQYVSVLTHSFWTKCGMLALWRVWTVKISNF